MIENPLKRALKRGETVWGTMVMEFGAPSVARILKRAGWDYIVPDLEHTAFSLETIGSMIQVAKGVDLPVIVRVPDIERSWISRALDAGALGVMVPRVEIKEQIEEAIVYAKYTPRGTRGVAIGTAHTDYQLVDGGAYTKKANEETMVVVQIESGKAVENLDAILSVPGVDVAFVGIADLATSLGIPIQFSHRKFVAAVERVIDRCRAHKVVPGMYVGSVEEAVKWQAKGMRVMMYGTEFFMIIERSQEVLGNVRKATGRSPKSSKSSHG